MQLLCIALCVAGLQYKPFCRSAAPISCGSSIAFSQYIHSTIAITCSCMHPYMAQEVLSLLGLRLSEPTPDRAVAVKWGMSRLTPVLVSRHHASQAYLSRMGSHLLAVGYVHAIVVRRCALQEVP